MNTAADEKLRNEEYFNAPVNRYVRDASTRIMAHSNSGSDNSPYRALARAVIFNALKDLKKQEAERKRTLTALKNSQRYEILQLITDDLGREMVIQYYDADKCRKFVIDLRHPKDDAMLFFHGENYIFYADIAGITVSGPELMRTFLAKHPGEIIVSLDKIIDG